MMGGHSLAMALLPAAVGYWVLTVSGKEKDWVKTLGMWLGVTIIALSIASTACKAYCMMGGQGVCSTKMACPFSSKPVPPAPQD